MSVQPNNNADAIQGEAERWFARLHSGECSVEERLDFNAWITADAAHAAAYAEIEQLWSELDGLAEDRQVTQWRREALRVSKARTARPRAWHVAAAASLVLVLLSGGGVIWWSGNTAVTSYATTRRERRSVSLTDGSRMVLNTATKLHARISSRVRGIQLRTGEAIFDVAHEAARPFIVHAGKTTITDLGTRFDVHHDGARTVVTVIEGRVSVARGARSARLARGEQLTVGNGIWRERRVNTAVPTAWTRGKLLFHATPLSKVVAESNRYGPGYLIIADSSLDRIKVSGQFRIGNTKALVRALQAVFPIHARAVPFSDKIRLYRKKSE